MTHVPTASPSTRQPLRPATPRERGVRDGVGTNARRPDGIPKVKGEFAYSSDLWAEGMLHGATVRSPHPSARILRIDTTAAAGMQGVRAVLTADDVPGAKLYGMEHQDQPVLAWDLVRYHGVFAPHHPWRAEIAAMCPACPTKTPTCGVRHVPAQRQPLDGGGDDLSPRRRAAGPAAPPPTLR